MEARLCPERVQLPRAMIAAVETALASGDSAGFDRERQAYIGHVRTCEHCGRTSTAEITTSDVEPDAKHSTTPIDEG